MAKKTCHRIEICRDKDRLYTDILDHNFIWISNFAFFHGTILCTSLTLNDFSTHSELRVPDPDSWNLQHHDKSDIDMWSAILIP